MAEATIAAPRAASKRRFPLAAAIFFGLGLGGFFDGIVLHQILQWHHMLSSWHPITSIEALELNTRWDGYFHSLTISSYWPGYSSSGAGAAPRPLSCRDATSSPAFSSASAFSISSKAPSITTGLACIT